VNESVTRWEDYETEKIHSNMAYDAVADICPVDMLPEDDPFGEVTAALVVGVDADNNFRVIATAPEEQQPMMSGSMEIVRDVLANFSDYKEVFTQKNMEDDSSE